MVNVSFVKVAQVTELPPGAKKVVKVRRDEVLLINVAGTIHACDAICTHQLYPLRSGDLDGAEITCPLHEAVFNVATGAVVTDPATEPLRLFEVRIEEPFILVGPEKN